MSPRVLGNLSPARFLAEYWQKQPLVVRGAWPEFRDPLTPEELAGLRGGREIVVDAGAGR